MASAEDVAVWNAAVQSYGAGDFDEAIRKFGSMSTVSARIEYNIGFAYFSMQNMPQAVKSFQNAVTKDSHLALGFFMLGISHLKQKSNSVALKDFRDAFRCMRGNRMVDYRQLGNKYQLHACEVLLNTAVAHSKTGQIEEARNVLLEAVQYKVEGKHDIVDDALTRIMSGFFIEPIVPLKTCIFKPPKAAVDNMKKKDYLGKAKVLFTADSSDSTPGFSGALKLKQTRQQMLEDIRVPDRKGTLRKAPNRPDKPVPQLKLGKVIEKPPPRKALPPAPGTKVPPRPESPHSRPGSNTWGGTSALPASKYGARSSSESDSSFSASTLPGKLSTGRSPLPPRKPPPQLPPEQDGSLTGMKIPPRPQKALPTGTDEEPRSRRSLPPARPLPSSSSSEEDLSSLPRRPPPIVKPSLPKSPRSGRSLGSSVSSEGEQSEGNKPAYEVEVQFSFSKTIRIPEGSSLSDVLAIISKLTVPKDVELCHTDSYGRQKEVSESVLAAILRKRGKDTKLLCFPK